MEFLDMNSLSNDKLMALAAEGDGDARYLLATRVRKLRWMGNDRDARSLMKRIKVGVATSAIPAEHGHVTD